MLYSNYAQIAQLHSNAHQSVGERKMPPSVSPPDPLTTLTQAVHHEQLAAQRLAMVLDHAVSFDLMHHLTTEVLVALDAWRVASSELFVYLSEPAVKAVEAGPIEDQIVDLPTGEAAFQDENGLPILI